MLILLQLRIGGINTATGAFFGAMFFALFKLAGDHHLGVSVSSHRFALLDLQYVLVALGAFVVSRDPNGLGGRIATLAEQLRHALTMRRRPSDSAPAETPERELVHV